MKKPKTVKAKRGYAMPIPKDPNIHYGITWRRQHATDYCLVPVAVIRTDDEAALVRQAANAIFENSPNRISQRKANVDPILIICEQRARAVLESLNIIRREKR